MSLVPGFRAFDPTVTASTGTQDHGGGLIGGAGTYCSKHSDISRGSDCTDIVVVTSASGPITGTITVEVSNSKKQADELGNGLWDTYDNLPLEIPAISGAVTFNLELTRLGFSRYRLKFVVDSGAGTITDERTIKGGV